MTYGTLRNKLATLSREQLDQTVTFELDSEFFAIDDFYIIGEGDILDSNHAVLRAR